MSRKKKFQCGHVGLGSFCHRCAQADALEKRSKKEGTKELEAALQPQIERLRAPSRKVGTA